MAALDHPVGSTRGGGVWLLSVSAWLGFLFLLLPTFIVVPMSFGNAYELVFPPTTFTTELYEQYFHSSTWVESTMLSLRVAIATTVLALLLGVPAAYSIARGTYLGRRFVAMLLMSPILVPIILVALGLYLYFLNLKVAGSELSLVVSHTVYATPFVIVTALAGLRHIDPNLERVATIMGAGALWTFWKVTLPLLRPSMVAGALFAFLMSFDEVVIAYFVTQAGAMTLPVRMYSTIQWEVSPVLAAISTLLTVLSLMICLLGASLQRKS